VSVVSYYQLLLVPYLRARLGLRPGGSGRGDEGASLVEYALLVALIAVVCILAITFLGRNASDKLSNVGSSIGS
jgi:pilus assembly protein Flp/PilA